jgi:hypothetical protein
MVEIGRVLRQHLGDAGRRVPRLEMPDWLARAIALVVPQMRNVLPMLGRRRRASSDKARRLLGWDPRPNPEIITSTADSLLALGLVKPWCGSRPDQRRPPSAHIRDQGEARAEISFINNVFTVSPVAAVLAD